jgi:hypothetical protein
MNRPMQERMKKTKLGVRNNKHYRVFTQSHWSGELVPNKPPKQTSTETIWKHWPFQGLLQRQSKWGKETTENDSKNRVESSEGEVTYIFTPSLLTESLGASRGGRSVGVVRSRTQTKECVCVSLGRAHLTRLRCPYDKFRHTHFRRHALAGFVLERRAISWHKKWLASAKCGGFL